MKKYTKKFLGSKAGPAKPTGAIQNAVDAQAKLEIPQDLWMEMTDVFEDSKLMKSLLDKPGAVETLFMAGFVCGWVEKNPKIK